MITVQVPVRVLPEANRRDHPIARWRRGKRQQSLVALMLRPAFGGKPVALPCVVTLARIIGPRGRVLDDDNNVSGCKAIRDAVAKCIGVDDGDARVIWSYEQRRGVSWGVEIRICPAVSNG